MKFTQVFKKFPRAFWVANTMELFERWAWYGLFAVLALYLTNSTDDGALGFRGFDQWIDSIKYSCCAKGGQRLAFDFDI